MKNLKGTEKQVKWAEDIITITLNNVKSKINWKFATPTEKQVWEMLYSRVEADFNEIDNAADIINRRDEFNSLISKLERLILNMGADKILEQLSK